MEYIDICKWVFDKEGQDWENHNPKVRERDKAITRHISIYLGHWFIPRLTNQELADMFGKNHATPQNSFKQVRNLMYSDKDFRLKMDTYIRELNEIFKAEDIEKNKKILEEENIRKKLLETISSMEIIARVYCDLKGLKLIEK